MRRCKHRSDKSKRFLFRCLFVGITVSLLLSTAVEAQTRANVERELQKTDDVIDRAREAVSASRNLKAENLLSMAVELQGGGREAGRQSRYRLALELTLKAREKAYEAIGYTRKDEENEHVVLRAIERTDQIIDKAKDAAADLDRKRARSLMEMTTGSQQKAKEFFREHRLKMALKFTLKARENARRLVELARNGKRTSRLAEKELQRAYELIEKSSVIISRSQNQSAEELLGRARSLQTEARDLANQEAFSRSMEMSQQARQMVEKALKLAEKDIAPEMAEQAIRQNEKLIRTGEEEMKAAAVPEAVRIFEQGLSHQDMARKHLQEGKYQAALAEAKVANRLLSDALEMIREGSQ
jgi:hypothetical protein